MAIELISKIKPKNNGDFKLVDVEDVEYNGKGLDEAIQSGEFKGEKGDPGNDGAPGPKGVDGKSAYQIAVDGGFQGSEEEWLASLKGEKGEPGQDGADGYSPTVSVTEEQDGVTVTVHNKDSEQTAKIKNGKDGKDYEHSEEFTALAEQVRADKESVDRTKTSIEQTVAQAEETIGNTKTIAVQEVQQEGTKQVTEIQSKGEEILQSFPQDFPTQMAAKLDKNQGVENAGKVLTVGEDGNVVPQEETTQVEVDSTLTQSGKAADAKATGDKILQFTIKNTVSGDSYLVVPDSAEEGILGLKVLGRSEQVTTKGLNLLDSTKILNTVTELDIIHSNDGGVIINGTPKSDVQIFFFGTYDNTEPIFNGMYCFRCYGLTSAERISMGFNSKELVTKTANESIYYDGEIGSVWITFKANKVYTNFKFYPMFNILNTPKPYEPYTGCKPAPSPEYPQEIVNAGNNGTVDIKINSNNLISPFKEMTVNKLATVQYDTHKSDELVITRLDGVKQYDGIQTSLILQKGTYTFAYDSIEGEFLAGNITGIRNEDENDRTLISLNNSNYKRGSFTLDKKTNIKLVVFSGNTKAGLAKIKGLRIGFLQEDNRWKPYEEQSLTFSTPNGLPRIPVSSGGNYTDSTGQQWICDEIDLARGKYVQRVEKYIFSGDEKVSISDNKGYMIPITQIGDNILENKGSLSNRFIYSKNAWIKNNDFGLQSGVVFIVDKNLTNFHSSDELKTFLKDNETYIIYPLIRPIETDLTPEEITTYKQLHTNYPTTVLTIDGGEVDPSIELTYVADTKNFILNNLAQTNQALANTQAQLL